MGQCGMYTPYLSGWAPCQNEAIDGGHCVSHTTKDRMKITELEAKLAEAREAIVLAEQTLQLYKDIKVPGYTQELERQLAITQKDTERLDWLATQHDTSNGSAFVEGEGCVHSVKVFVNQNVRDAMDRDMESTS